jgi:hypothetical protein
MPWTVALHHVDGFADIAYADIAQDFDLAGFRIRLYLNRSETRLIEHRASASLVDASSWNDRPLTDHLAAISTEGLADDLFGSNPFHSVADFPVRPLKGRHVLSPNFCRHCQEAPFDVFYRFLNGSAGNDCRTAGGSPRIEGTRQRVGGSDENFFEWNTEFRRCNL